MQYVMNDLEKGLYKLIEEDGFKTAIQALARACMEYGHSSSDLGLKERATEAFEVADLLKDVRDQIEE